MAIPQDGTYIIRPVNHPGLCLDCQGDSDRSGANVLFEAYSGRDTQLVQVNHVAGDMVTLSFPATGKFVDVTNAAFTSGSNIQQCDGRYSKAQFFTLVEGGGGIRIRCNDDWDYEGVGWNAPSSGDDVYRLYSPDGNHMLTTSAGERDFLLSVGWSDEGVAFKSGGDVEIYRMYNQYNGDHLFTASESEKDSLASIGWSYEGVAMKGASSGGTPIHRVYDGRTHLFTANSYEANVLTGAIGDSWWLGGADYQDGNARVRTTAEAFTFEEARTLPDGVYEVIPMSATGRRIGVSGGSSCSGARAVAGDSTGSNDQRIRVSNSNGTTMLSFEHSGLSMGASGDSVIQGGADSSWVLVPDGLEEIGGSRVQCYRISNVVGSNRVIDASDPSSLSLRQASGSPSQRFAFVPDDVVSDGLPTPSGVGFVIGGEVVTSGARPFGSARLFFRCPGDTFKARYRYRVGRVGTSGVAWGEWSAWKSAFDGSCSHFGWGDMGRPNAIFTNAPNDKATGVLPFPAIVLNRDVAIQLQGEARCCAMGPTTTGGMLVSNSGVSGTVTLSYRPTLVIGDPFVSARGVSVPYTSDWKSGGCTLAISKLDVGGASLLDATRRTTGMSGAAGSVSVDWASLTSFPTAGLACSARARLETGILDSSWVTASGSLVIGSNSREIHPVVTESDHGTYVIKPDTDGEARVILHNGGPMEVSRLSNGTFDVFVPLMTECHATVIEVDKSGTWGAKDVVLPAITSHSFCWGFGDGDWAVLDFGRETTPSQDSKRERNYESYVTTGRDFPTTRYLGGGKRDVSVTGTVIEEVPSHGTKEAFVRLLEAGHATFRNRRGEVVTVAVTAISDPVTSDDYTDITVEQHQETR